MGVGWRTERGNGIEARSETKTLYRYSGDAMLYRVDTSADQPAWWNSIGLPTEAWPQFVAADKANQKRHYLARVNALFEYFAIDPRPTGAILDLGLSLALRHSPDFIDLSGRVQFARLCDRLGVDYSSPVAGMAIALKIAHKHIPGFQRKWAPFGRGRLVDRRFEGRRASQPVVDFIVITSRIQFYLEGNGSLKPAPALQIAKYFVSPTMLHRISPETAKLARDFRAAHGNAGNPLSESAIQKLIGQRRNDRRALAAGTANGFQKQLIFEALDLMADQCQSALALNRHVKGGPLGRAAP